MKTDNKILVSPGSDISLKNYDPSYTGEFKNKDDASEKLKKDIEKLGELQDVLYASDTYSLLIVFQAMDAAGKDGTIKHVMSGVNPQGCDVYSFKQPSTEELAHDFLWRVHTKAPQKGKIAIFNRSYYEDVLVTKVHPEFILHQHIPGVKSVDDINDEFWHRRYERIKSFEKMLFDNGTIIIKFFLHVSKEEQKRRFLERIEMPEKNWKFSANDLKERAFWHEYQKAYEKAISNTSVEHAPWYVIPADHKWFMRAAVGDIIVGSLKELKLKYPKISEEAKQQLDESKKTLMDEKD